MKPSATPMSPRERELFVQALELPTPEERAGFLDRACGSDIGSRRRLEALLNQFNQLGTFLENPVVSGPERAPQAAHSHDKAGSATTLRTITEKPGDRIGRFTLFWIQAPKSASST